MEEEQKEEDEKEEEENNCTKKNKKKKEKKKTTSARVLKLRFAERGLCECTRSNSQHDHHCYFHNVHGI